MTDYEALYDLPEGVYDGRGVEGVRTATIRAGRSLEVMCHPIARLTPGQRREARAKRTTPAMAKVNLRNTQRHYMRLLEENFTGEALVATLTYSYPVEDYGMCDLEELSDIYDRQGLPEDPERVKMDVRNLLARIKRRMASAGADPSELKWIQRIEEGKTPPVAGLPPKYHVHMVIEGKGVSRELVERLWSAGHTHVDRFDLTGDGPARLARYLSKQRRGGRWWSHSRNLRIPAPRISDRRISRRRLSRIAVDVQRDGRAILEGMYPGYRLVEAEVKFSDYAPGAFIYARLRRRE